MGGKCKGEGAGRGIARLCVPYSYICGISACGMKLSLYS